MRFSRDEIPWQQLVDASTPAIIWSTDVSLRVVTCFGNGCQQLTKSIGGVAGIDLPQLLREGSIQAPLLDAHRRALQGEPASITFHIDDAAYCGTVRPLRFRESIVGCNMVAFDRTCTDSRCQSIAETAVDLILFLTPDGTIEDTNRSTKGTSRNSIIGKSIYDYVPFDAQQAMRETVATVLETGNVSSLEIEFPERTGNISWQAIRIGPIRISDRTTGAVVLATDITERKQALEKLQAEESLLRQLLQLQDRERRMVAYEIHDGFIQDVVGARMTLQGVQPRLAKLAPELNDAVETASKFLGRAIREGRRLISELRPMIIDEMGIVEAIDYLIQEEAAEGNIEFEFHHRTTTERFDPLLQATVFHITREATTNARRHGRAKHIEIRLTEIGNLIVLEIIDDGRGFNPNAVKTGRFGLQGMRDRAKLFGGGATIESRRGRGTRITVKLQTELPDATSITSQPNWHWTI